MQPIQTHQKISKRFCGSPVDVSENHAVVELQTIPEMSVDDRRLVHGGFIFGLADFAAMIAVNDPNVVLGSSQCVFKKPVKSGDKLRSEAQVVETKAKKRLVKVIVKREEEIVFQGEFTCFVLDNHVLDNQ